MKYALVIRIALCAAGFILAAVIVPGVEVTSWHGFVFSACVLAVIYTVLRLVTRIVTLVFDLLLLGIPCLFFETMILRLVANLMPGFFIMGYWQAMGMLLLGLTGMWIGRNIHVSTPRQDA